MKIAEVKKLDDGVSGIIIEGRIIKTPKPPKDGQYGWSQMIILKDDTDEISSWINIKSAEDAYKVGQYIKVQGKVSKYVKGGKQGISLNNGNVIDEIQKDKDVSREQPTTQKTTQEEYTKDDYWRDKALRDIENNKCIVRECAIKAVSEEVVINLFNILDEVQYFSIADKIVNYINQQINKIEMIKPPITLVEKSKEEFGGTTTEVKENPYLPKGYEGEKDQKIAQARELVRNPHLAEPVNDKMATVPQKKQIYGYINEKGEKIKGIVDSQYITKEEVKKICKAQDLTKADGIRYWDYWYGKEEEEEVGEREKRKMVADEKKEQEANPFNTKREPIEKRDPKDDTSLAKDLIVEKINKMRETYGLMDETKFMKAFGCNTKFELWTEKELKILKEKIEMWKPDWVKGK